MKWILSSLLALMILSGCASPEEKYIDQLDEEIDLLHSEQGIALDLGETICVSLDHGMSPQEISSVLSNSMPTDEADAIISAERQYLCP